MHKWNKLPSPEHKFYNNFTIPNTFHKCNKMINNSEVHGKTFSFAHFSWGSSGLVKLKIHCKCWSKHSARTHKAITILFKNSLAVKILQYTSTINDLKKRFPHTFRLTFNWRKLCSTWLTRQSSQFTDFIPFPQQKK